MNTSGIVAEIDAQIAKLQQARALLAGVETAVSTTTIGVRKRGRPKGSVKKVVVNTTSTVTAPSKRVLSAAGRKAIAAAMKKRWAERRKAQKA